MAVTLNRVADVRFHLLDPSLNPNFRDGVALRTAIQYGYHDVVQVLLDDVRLDPTLENNAALLLSMRCGNLEVVKVLLSDSRIISHLRREGLQTKCGVSLRMVQLVSTAINAR